MTWFFTRLWAFLRSDEGPATLLCAVIIACMSIALHIPWAPWVTAAAILTLIIMTPPDDPQHPVYA